MKFNNVKVKYLFPTQSGTSKKTGNPYQIKEVVFEIPTDNPDYPQSICAKTMNAAVISILEAAKVGDAYASVDIDFEAREYNGRYYTDNKLWLITGATQPAAQPEAPAPAVQQPAPAVQSNETITVGGDDLPF